MFHISMGGVFQIGGGGGGGQASFLCGKGTPWEGIGFGGGQGVQKKIVRWGGCPLCPSPNTGNPALSSNM